MVMEGRESNPIPNSGHSRWALKFRETKLNAVKFKWILGHFWFWFSSAGRLSISLAHAKWSPSIRFRVGKPSNSHLEVQHLAGSTGRSCVWEMMLSHRHSWPSSTRLADGSDRWGATSGHTDLNWNIFSKEAHFGCYLPCTERNSIYTHIICAE